MKQFTFLIFICLITSCSEKKKEFVNRNCRVSILLYGAPWEAQFSAFFNAADKYGDSLIVSKYLEINGKDSSVFKKLILGKPEQDSLYGFFENIHLNFKLKDEESQINDGTKVRIAIASQTNSINYFYTGLPDAASADPNIANLVAFINRRLPKDFQMY